MDAATPTSRVALVGVLVLLSFTLLLTLIQHPVFTLGLILILLWLFLHPQEAENLWRSALPAISEAFSKAVQEVAAVSPPEKQGPSSAAERLQALSKALEQCSAKREDPEGENSKRQTLIGWTSDVHNCDGPLLDLDNLLGLEDDGGDIEIEPLEPPGPAPKPLDHPDLLQPLSAHMDPKPQQIQPLDRPVAKPRPSKQLSLDQQRKPAPSHLQPSRRQVDNGSGPDVIIMNAPGTATYRRHFGGSGDDEFYITSVDYEQFEFEPLIITGQVPETTDLFEQLTEKRKAEWLKEQEMRVRLSRSLSRMPSDAYQ